MRYKFKIVVLFFVFGKGNLNNVQSQNISYAKSTCIQLTQKWEQATLKNIDYQLKLNSTSKDSFTKGVLLRQKDFIKYESEIGGLRRNFIDSFYNSKMIGSPNCMYVIENYSSGEGFRAWMYVFTFGHEKKMYGFQLLNGHWQLAHSETLDEITIGTEFKAIRNYFCDDYFLDESIIISKMENCKFVSKGLFFPCNQKFISIKRIINKYSLQNR